VNENAQLPQGYGIAARYPGEKGIANDPAVLFAEDFESGSVEAMGQRWQAVSNKDGTVFALPPDVPEGSAGRHSLQMTATLGVNEGGHLYTTFPSADTAFLRFYVKFAEDAGYMHHGVILGAYNPPTPFPQGKAGLRPEGDDRAHAGIEPIPGDGQYPPPGIWYFYTYWQEMKVSREGKYWGNGFLPDHPVPAVRGKWQCVEIMMKMNSEPEASDGELALWIDGRLEAHFAKGAPRASGSGPRVELVKEGGESFEGFRFRKSKDLKVNFLWLEHYVTQWVATRYTQGTQNPINRVLFDDVVVSREYIGPIKK